MRTALERYLARWAQYGICKDVSGLGRWGNGDVEVGLNALEELPYVMTLVRQALDRQLYNGEE